MSALYIGLFLAELLAHVGIAARAFLFNECWRLSMSGQHFLKDTDGFLS